MEPCGPKGKMIRNRRAQEVVYAVGYAFEDGVVGQALKRCLRHARSFCLAACDEAPLVLGDL